MTDIAFHFNVPDKLHYTCRLLRKAVRSQSSVGVVGPSDVLKELDRQLWCFEPLEFLAHAHVRLQKAPLARYTQVWLSESVHLLPPVSVLVNLGTEVPDGFGRFDRLIEIVSFEDHDRHEGRQRWKQYTEQGLAIVRHDVSA